MKRKILTTLLLVSTLLTCNPPTAPAQTTIDLDELRQASIEQTAEKIFGSDIFTLTKDNGVVFVHREDQGCRFTDTCRAATQVFDTVTNGLIWFGWNPGVSWTGLFINSSTSYCWATWSLTGIGIPENQIPCGWNTFFIRTYPNVTISVFDTSVYCDTKVLSFFNPCDYLPIYTHGHHGHNHRIGSGCDSLNATGVAGYGYATIPYDTITGAINYVIQDSSDNAPSTYANFRSCFDPIGVFHFTYNQYKTNYGGVNDYFTFGRTYPLRIIANFPDGSSCQKYFSMTTPADTSHPVVQHPHHHHRLSHGDLNRDEKEIRQILVFDVSGRWIASANDFDIMEDDSNLITGIYLLKVVYNDQTSQMSKMLIY